MFFAVVVVAVVVVACLPFYDQKVGCNYQNYYYYHVVVVVVFVLFFLKDGVYDIGFCKAL